MQLRLAGGANVLMHGSCATPGRSSRRRRSSAASGAAWLQGDEVWVDDGRHPHQVPAPADLVPLPPSPPPAELLHTTYDMWHSMGIDLDPYTRLYGVLRDRVLGKDVTPRSPGGDVRRRGRQSGRG